MSFLQSKIDLETYIKANVTGTNLVFENQSQKNDVLEWIRVNILNAKGSQISLGSNPYYRYNDLLIFQIFTKPNIGSGRAISLADLFTSLFRSKTINGMTFRTPEVDKIGESGGWYQINVSIPFSREEV